MPPFRPAGHLRLVSPDLSHAGVEGRAQCSAQHGEILRGAFWAYGTPSRALVTLPYPGASATAVARLVPDDATVVVHPKEKARAAVAAHLTLRELRLSGGCRVELSGDIPTGWGLGSSTADVVATVRAVAAAAGRVLPPETVARLVATAGRASGSIMFEGAVTLFADREGRVLEVLAPALPPLLVVGCNAGGGAGADTAQAPAQAPAQYLSGEVEQLGYLLAMLRRALSTQNAMLLGRVATRSAAINQRFRPLAPFAELCRIAESTGAAGVQVAHSGTVAGLVYDAADPRVRRRADRGRVELAGLGLGPTWVFAPPAAVLPDSAATHVPDTDAGLGRAAGQ